ALAWPADSDASNLRYGYTVTDNIYLNANQANGTVVRIDSGYAYLYAGQPMNGGHRLLATLWSGDSFTVSGLIAGEVLSVQSESDFTYRVEVAPPSTPPGNEPPVEDPPNDPPPGTPTSLSSKNVV